MHYSHAKRSQRRSGLHPSAPGSPVQTRSAHVRHLPPPGGAADRLKPIRQARANTTMRVAGRAMGTPGNGRPIVGRSPGTGS